MMKTDVPAKSETDESALRRLTSSSLQLLWIRRWQGLLAFLWLAGFVLFLIPGLTSPPRSVVFVFVSIPFLIVALASLQAWRSRRAQRFYRTIRNSLRKSRIGNADRARAQAALYDFQTSSLPLFVRGDSSKSLALALLILVLACSLILAMRMT